MPCCRRRSDVPRARSQARDRAPARDRPPSRRPGRSRRRARLRTASRTSPQRKRRVTQRDVPACAAPPFCSTGAGVSKGQSLFDSALLLELALDRVAVLLRAGAGGLALGLLGPGLTLLLGLLLALLLLVQDLADLRRGSPQRLRGGFDPFDVVRLEGIA